MRGDIIALGLALVAMPVNGQTSYPGVTATEVETAIAAMTPPPCPTPLPDTLMGGAGAQPTCMSRPDATRPTVIQAKNVVTASDATWSVTFDRPFAGPPIYVDARVYGGGGQPYLCTILTTTAEGANGKCYQLVATTLPSVVTALAGTVVSPISAAGAGLSVRVVARQ